MRGVESSVGQAGGRLVAWIPPINSRAIVRSMPRRQFAGSRIVTVLGKRLLQCHRRGSSSPLPSPLEPPRRHLPPQPIGQPPKTQSLPLSTAIFPSRVAGPCLTWTSAQPAWVFISARISGVAACGMPIIFATIVGFVGVYHCPSGQSLDWQVSTVSFFQRGMIFEAFRVERGHLARKSRQKIG